MKNNCFFKLSKKRKISKGWSLLVSSVFKLQPFSNMSLLALNQTDKKSKCCVEKNFLLFCCSNFHLFSVNMFHLFYQISRRKSLCGEKYQVSLSDGLSIDPLFTLFFDDKL